ncbi:MAG: hypothetical protein KDA21_05125 [Phycisphaerales bacterium]|nr:hypothetical protein [Phycisphaerales bacterium]
MSDQVSNGREGLRLTRPDAGRASQFDALAELFLGDETPRSPAAPRPEPAPPRLAPSEVTPTPREVRPDPAPSSPPPAPADGDEGVTLEVLMLGHLPVRATPWVGQYARRLALELDEPVILLRMESERASLRLFGMDFESAPSFESLNDAIAWAGGVARRWVLQVTELDEPTLATGRAIDCVTLLTGADDAAIVAAYGTIKRLAESSVGWGDELGSPTLRIATMGSDETTSRAAFERLERAASIYLGREIELAANVERMGATGAVVLHECEVEGGIATVIDRILLNDVDMSEARPASRPTAAMPPAAVSVPPQVTATARLARQVAGLSPLDLTCPDDDLLEFAADGEGVMHVLCRVAEDKGHDGTVTRLLAGASWARRHASLIGRACADAHLDLDAPVAIHLFTARPADIRHLLHTDIRCHVLARAGEGWFCAPLN